MNINKQSPATQALLVMGIIPAAIILFALCFILILGGIIVANTLGGLIGLILFLLLLIYFVIYIFIKIS